MKLSEIESEIKALAAGLPPAQRAHVRAAICHLVAAQMQEPPSLQSVQADVLRGEQALSWLSGTGSIEAGEGRRRL